MSYLFLNFEIFRILGSVWTSFPGTKIGWRISQAAVALRARTMCWHLRITPTECTIRRGRKYACQGRRELLRVMEPEQTAECGDSYLSRRQAGSRTERCAVLWTKQELERNKQNNTKFNTMDTPTWKSMCWGTDLISKSLHHIEEHELEVSQKISALFEAQIWFSILTISSPC